MQSANKAFSRTAVHCWKLLIRSYWELIDVWAPFLWHLWSPDSAHHQSPVFCTFYFESNLTTKISKVLLRADWWLGPIFVTPLPISCHCSPCPPVFCTFDFKSNLRVKIDRLTKKSLRSYWELIDGWSSFLWHLSPLFLLNISRHCSPHPPVLCTFNFQFFWNGNKKILYNKSNPVPIIPVDLNFVHTSSTLQSRFKFVHLCQN